MKNNRVVESSLGYFINPLMSVALGVIFFSEKLPRLQWIAIAFAAMGVGYITYQLGAVPWLALTLAGSFALYGIVKKQMPLPALMGLWLETAVLIVPATMFIAWKWYYGTGGFGNFGLATDLLIVSTGPVTTIPLLLFAIGAKSIPLSQMGFLQYIAPSLQFLIGWIVYHEAVDVNRWIGFACVWTGLAIFVMTQRRGQ